MMDSISELALKRISEKRRRLNPNYELALQIASLTKTEPRRWLRYTSKHVYAVNRALIDFKELYDPTKIRSKAGYFSYLIGKHLAS